MDPTDLYAYVNRSKALREASMPTSRVETRAWLVDPLLAVLGWGVYEEECQTDVTVGDCRLEYVLSVAAAPAMVVAIEPHREGLEAEREREIQAVLARTGVDRAIYTDGATVALLAGEDTLECRLEALPEYADALTHFSRATLETRLKDDSRSLARRRLAVDQDRLVETITAELASVAGDDHRTELQAATGAFLDRILEALTVEDGSDDLEFDGSSANEPEEDPSGTETSTDSGEDGPTETDLERNTPASPPDVSMAGDESVSGEEDATDDDGEYVVRFFAERGSIGAVGHSSPEDTMVQAARFLFERGLSGIQTPWPEDGLTILNDAPRLADGSPMAACRKLPNGLYLNTDGDADELAHRVTAMAERAGFRAMVTGDWED